MSITYLRQDLVPVLKARDFEAFMHGCNCFCNMGAGIAVPVKDNFPEVYAADCATKKGDQSKLGTIGIVEIEPGKIIVNGYTQFRYGGGRVNADYNAIKSCFQKLNQEMLSRGMTDLVIPKIGAGHAGGDWAIIEEIIKEVMDDSIKIRVYHF